MESISLFQTTPTHPDRSRVIIPNRKIVGGLRAIGRVLREMEPPIIVSMLAAA